MADETEYVDKLLVSVNDAARNTRNVLLVFLLAGLYFAILIVPPLTSNFCAKAPSTCRC